VLIGNNSNTERDITLGLLRAVEGNSDLTQRTLARELGIALGLANSYVKRCISKGLIKARQVPRNRYAYYLTPKGFAEKTRLTAEFFSQSLSFFRQAQRDTEEIILHCKSHGRTRIALMGAGELAEIFVLVARAHALSIVGIVDPKTAPGEQQGVQVVSSLPELGEIDVCVITDFKNPRLALKTALEVLPVDQVLAPALLELGNGNGSGDHR
jgi:DNA-binding MarR family transcriptional regulator